ncbi:SRPBCC domain-containing protein [Cryptosporangium sp. NPDC048952]|uniref:SRPBCC domain-containing protein n=1 Tax=Cryptosporangium sp. NPDC048952 TaxID=3363961 RepID=UPI00372002E3
MARDEVVFSEIHGPLDAVVERDETRWTLVLRRAFRHDAKRLWEMLVDPARLRKWSPIVPDRPLTSVGPATCRENPDDAPNDAEVLLVDPPHVLVHRWGTDLMRWTVTPSDDGCVLELRQTFDDRSMAPAYAAGWQVCLGRLAAEDDTDRERVTGPRALDYGWPDLRDSYESGWS